MEKHPTSQVRRTQNPDIPRAGPGGAAHGDAAGKGGAGLDAGGSVRPGNNPTFLFPKASKTNVLSVFPEARTHDFLCKPLGDHDGRVSVQPQQQRSAQVSADHEKNTGH